MFQTSGDYIRSRCRKSVRIKQLRIVHPLTGLSWTRFRGRRTITAQDSTFRALMKSQGVIIHLALVRQIRLILELSKVKRKNKARSLVRWASIGIQRWLLTPWRKSWETGSNNLTRHLPCTVFASPAIVNLDLWSSTSLHVQSDDWLLTYNKTLSISI